MKKRDKPVFMLDPLALEDFLKEYCEKETAFLNSLYNHEVARIAELRGQGIKQMKKFCAEMRAENKRFHKKDALQCPTTRSKSRVDKRP